MTSFEEIISNIEDKCRAEFEKEAKRQKREKGAEKGKRGLKRPKGQKGQKGEKEDFLITNF